MNSFERQVRAHVMASFVEAGRPPSLSELASALGAAGPELSAALRSLADEHCLVLLPGSESIWMAHPFSGIETDFRVTIGNRRWYANCVWDGLSILALLGDGFLDTHSPASGEPLRYAVSGGGARGDGVVHFLVRPRHFWDDIGYT